MKRSKLFLAPIFFLLMMCASGAMAQYKPVVVEGNQWSNRLQSFLDIDLSQWFDGDSLIGEQTYYKLWTQVNGQADVILEGLIREDDVEQKVYAWVGGEEVLMYDFDVMVGETISVYVYGCTVDLVVTDVATIMLEGEEYEMIVFDNEYWIEGIGSIYTLQGAGYYNCIADVDPVLLCFFEQGELKFSNDDFTTDCETVDIEEPTIELGVAPNPATAQVRVSGNFESFATYAVFDSRGRLVMQDRVVTPGMLIIDLSEVESGYYILRMMDEGLHGVTTISRL
jgi:hypothetical protein